MNATAIFSSRSSRSLALVSSLAVLLALGACGKQGEEQRTVGQQVDSAISKTEQAAKEMKQDAKAVAQDTKAAAKETASAMAEKLDDASITASVSASLAKDPELSAIKIDVDTKNGVVNLSGPAPNTGARERAALIAKGVKGVNAVNNQLIVKAS